MEMFIKKMAKRVPEFGKALEKELQSKYAIKDFQLQICSRFSLYQANCTDEVNGFCMADKNTFEEVMTALTNQLTCKSSLKKKKIAKAKRMLKEAEEEE